MQRIFDVGSAEELLAVAPGATGISDWLTIDQALIDRFAEATGDRQWIHVDPERAAREMPDGRTIAHGYLTLSLTPQLLDGAWAVHNERQSLNYGLEKVRFVSPVPSGSRVRMRTVLGAASPWRDGVKIELNCSIEIEGSERPAVAFTQIAVFMFH